MKTCVVFRLFEIRVFYLCRPEKRGETRDLFETENVKKMRFVVCVFNFLSPSGHEFAQKSHWCLEN